MAGTARTMAPDNRLIMRIRRRIPPRAKPALRRIWALVSICRHVPRWTWLRARDWFARTRLVTWVCVIRRVRNQYHQVFGRMPSLLRPRRFTEKVQWRKLFELDPLFAIMSDKLAARDFIAGRIGAGRQAELLWVGDNPDAIPFDWLAPPYVLKSTHGSGHTIFVRDKAALDQAAVRAAARAWLAHCHGTSSHEPAYIHLPRRLIAERLLCNADGGTPIERRVFVFDGRAALIQTTVVVSDGVLRTPAFHTRAWERVPIRLISIPDVIPPPRPPLLPDILDLAERIGAGLSHCRVDVYDCGDQLVIGEITLYSWSGLARFHDPAYDLALGAPWTIRRPVLRALRAIARQRWEIRPPPG